MNIRRRPNRSAARPPRISRPPKAIAYAVMIHCTASAGNPSSVSMDGSATLTMLKSRTTMNAAVRMRARVTPRSRAGRGPGAAAGGGTAGGAGCPDGRTDRGAGRADRGAGRADRGAGRADRGAGRAGEEIRWLDWVGSLAQGIAREHPPFRYATSRFFAVRCNLMDGAGIPPDRREVGHAPPGPDLPGRRGRPRSEEADRAILAAATELLAERGLGGMSMEEVAAWAGVGKATVYRRWGSRGALAID